jgi:hypothetical protein
VSAGGWAWGTIKKTKVSRHISPLLVLRVVVVRVVVVVVVVLLLVAVVVV